ncbi:MAG: guanylate kinase [Lachnospiraceae bacterium]|nr:guanylate kinase [Lachnospiraceae bacterium]
MEKGKLIIISGFSGVGKGTVVKSLTEKYDDCVVSVSATTRNPREGEVDGKHYFFKTRDEFEKMIEEDKLLEHAEYVGNYYGTPNDFVTDNLNKGNHVILEIEVQGALKVKDKVADAKSIFILPPSSKALKDRLVGRGTEKEDVINERLKRASEETDLIGNYDYYVVNDTIDECVQDIRDIIDGNFNNELGQSFINQVKEEVKLFSKGEQ